MISCKKLADKMNEKNVTKYYLRKHGINPNMLNKMLATGDFGSKTVDRLCKILECQPGDIMEYIPDTKEADTDENTDNKPGN